MGSKRQCKDTIVTITIGRTDGQAVWQVSQRDQQTNRMCTAECAHGDYLPVCCVCVCLGEQGSECLFALVCLRICFSELF